MIRFIASLLVFSSVAYAMCPNSCSGHGKCNQFDICTCDPGWSNYDCSERECRKGIAWFSYSKSVLDESSLAHPGISINWDDNPATPKVGTHKPIDYVECSNNGICERRTGECKCFAGFYGASCDRSRCPGEGHCSGHGRCETVASANKIADDTIDYSDWDADFLYGCICDSGYIGYDCSKRLCPRGEDPMTDYFVDNPDTDADDAASERLIKKEVLEFKIEDTNPLDGDLQIQFSYYGVSVKWQYDADSGDFKGNLEEALAEHEYINSVTVSDVDTDTNTEVTWKITFDALYPRFSETRGAIDVNLGYATGTYFTKSDNSRFVADAFRPSEPTITCDTAGDNVFGIGGCDTARSVAVVVEGKYEHLECGGRGKCDYRSGICRCFTGFTGEACERINALAIQSA